MTHDVTQRRRAFSSFLVKWHEEGEKNNAYFLGLMNSKYTRLDLHKVTDEVGTATDKETIMEKVKGFYQNLYKKRNLFNNCAEFLTNVPKISGAARAAMEADLTLEELPHSVYFLGICTTSRKCVQIYFFRLVQGYKQF